MRTFSMAFIGGFSGKIVATLFIAVCIAYGLGPDKWAKFMIGEMPATLSWITPNVARVAFLTLGVLTFIAFFVRPFSLGKWFERDYLELYELAFLSVGGRPKRRKAMPDDVVHRLRLLKDAINEGKLTARNLNADGKPNMMSQVHRDDFAKFAVDNNHKDFINLAKCWAKKD